MKYLKLIVLLFSSWHLLTNTCDAKINVVSSFTSIPELIPPPLENKLEVLYVFDVDETLITYKDVALREHNRESIKGKELQAYFNANCKKPNDPQYGQRIWSQIFLQAHKIIIDPPVKEIICRLQKKGFPLIALTRLLTGKFGDIQNLQNWRYQQLANLGIDFSKSAPIKDIAFKELHLKKASVPILFKGILFTDNNSKKDTLQAFLNQFQLIRGFLPKKIIYIDDTFSYLEEVEKLCNSLKINFIGYYYLGSKYLPEKFNVKIAQEQINHLIANESWISDFQAQILLEKQLN